MDQRFEAKLVSKEPIANVLMFAKAVFFDLKGCTILGAVQEDGEICVTFQVAGVEEPCSDRLLRSFLSILTDRHAGLSLKSARSLGVRNVHDHVSKILISTGAGRAS